MSTFCPLEHKENEKTSFFFTRDSFLLCQKCTQKKRISEFSSFSEEQEIEENGKKEVKVSHLGQQYNFFESISCRINRCMFPNFFSTYSVPYTTTSAASHFFLHYTRVVEPFSSLK